MSHADRAAEALRERIAREAPNVRGAIDGYRAAVIALADTADLIETMKAVAQLHLCADALKAAAAALSTVSKDALAETMADVGSDPIFIATHQVVPIAKTGSVAIDNEAAFLARYPELAAKPKADLTAIRRRLDAGEALEGARVVGNGSPSISFRIRTRKVAA